MPELKPGLRRDYRSVACPLNFAKITMDLVNMEIGQVIEVRMESEEAADKVTKSLMRDGQSVLAKSNDKGCWTIIIRKDKEYE